MEQSCSATAKALPLKAKLPAVMLMNCAVPPECPAAPGVPRGERPRGLRPNMLLQPENRDDE